MTKQLLVIVLLFSMVGTPLLMILRPWDPNSWFRRRFRKDPTPRDTERIAAILGYSFVKEYNQWFLRDNGYHRYLKNNTRDIEMTWEPSVSYATAIWRMSSFKVSGAALPDSEGRRLLRLYYMLQAQEKRRKDAENLQVSLKKKSEVADKLTETYRDIHASGG
jgi:hypothetical protein